MLIRECIEKYLVDVLITKTPDTYKYYKYHTKTIFYSFGYKDIDDVSYENIVDYVKYLHDNSVLNNTINKRVGILKILNRLYGSNTNITNFPKLKIRQKTFDFLSFNEVKKLISYVSTLPLKKELIFRLFLDTGIRLNELLNIDFMNIYKEKFHA